MHQCGLPKEMAIELFQPFVIPSPDPAEHRQQHQGRQKADSARR